MSSILAARSHRMAISGHAARIPDVLVMERGQTPRRRVLVVEDDETTRELLVELLAGEGHEVHVARDGLEGLAQAQEVRPDVILLDLLLPRMDGRDFLIAYRAATGGGAVVIVSGAMDLDVPLADAVIAKPFAIDGLLRAVEAACPREEGRVEPQG